MIEILFLTYVFVESYLKDMYVMSSKYLFYGSKVVNIVAGDNCELSVPIFL